MLIMFTTYQTHQNLIDHIVEQIHIGHELVHQNHQLAVDVLLSLGHDKFLVLFNGRAHPAAHHQHGVQIALRSKYA